LLHRTGFLPRTAPLRLAACALGSALLGGCTPTTGDVSGVVRLRGQAPNLDGLQLSFLGKDGRPVMAAVNPDGTYKAVGVPPGEVRVGVVWAPPDEQPTDLAAPKAKLQNQDPSRMSLSQLREWERQRLHPDAVLSAPKHKGPIPERYLDPATSRLTLTVEAGKDNPFDVDVRP
jgi:hypothetical protein